MAWCGPEPFAMSGINIGDPSTRRSTGLSYTGFERQFKIPNSKLSSICGEIRTRNLHALKVASLPIGLRRFFSIENAELRKWCSLSPFSILQSENRGGRNRTLISRFGVRVPFGRIPPLNDAPNFALKRTVSLCAAGFEPATCCF